MHRPALMKLTLGVGMLLIVLGALSACGGGGSAEKAPFLETVAGDGGSQLGDGGPATKAGLCGPTDVALDAKGNMYILDTGDFCDGPGGATVRKVDPDGIISTFAGTGEYGFSGDGGPATKARLYSPSAVAVDRDGNLYISDGGVYRIRKVDENGIITTIAGTGERGYSGDGGPATSAKLTEPSQMTFDDRGNLYFVDYTTVRKIDPSGTITTVAGTGRLGFSGDGGPAIEARFEANDLALDRGGNMYIADTENNRIRKVDKDGIIHTVAGTGKEGYSGDGGPAIKAALNLPTGIALDGEGNLFIACHHNSRVRKVDKDGTITTVAGTGGMGFNREKGPARKVMLNQPWDVNFDEDSGDLYIADAFNSRIRAVSWGGT